MGFAQRNTVKICACGKVVMNIFVTVATHPEAVVM
jgi:hypothetical protein